LDIKKIAPLEGAALRVSARAHQISEASGSQFSAAALVASRLPVVADATHSIHSQSPTATHRATQPLNFTACPLPSTVLTYGPRDHRRPAPTTARLHSPAASSRRPRALGVRHRAHPQQHAHPH